MFKKNCIAIIILMVVGVSCTKKKSFDEKVLNVVVAAKVKGLDPVNAGDTYSSTEIARVYEGLLEYHYLKRPYELQPNLAESMPEVSEDGLTSGSSLHAFSFLLPYILLYDCRLSTVSA